MAVIAALLIQQSVLKGLLPLRGIVAPICGVPAGCFPVFACCRPVTPFQMVCLLVRRSVAAGDDVLRSERLPFPSQSKVEVPLPRSLTRGVRTGGLPLPWPVHFSVHFVATILLFFLNRKSNRIEFTLHFGLGRSLAPVTVVGSKPIEGD